MNSLIGDRQFYRKVLMVAVPIMVQNGITNFVNMLDNIMVGQIGTEPMSGVAIVKDNLCHVLLFTKISQFVDDSHICVEIYTTAFSCSSLCLSPL